MDPTLDGTLAGRFARGLALAPDRPALRADGVDVTYRALHARALVLAGSLRAGLPDPPPAVGVLAGKGPTAYAALLAGLYSGVTVVPLQPAFPAARTRQMIEAAGVGALLADDDALPALTALHEAGVCLPTLFPPGGQPLPALPVDTDSALKAPLPARPSDTAYVLFTSGSTGRPKGVPVTHANTAHYFGLLDERYDFGPHDVFSQTFDLNFDCAMFDLFCAWGAGAAVVPVPARAYAHLPEFLAEQRMTVWFSTPSAITLVRRTGGLRPGALPSLRWSFFAGEALSCKDAEDWAAAAPGATLENLYGPTELTITITAHRWTPGRYLNDMVPIGAVHPGHETLLLDPAGAPSTDGEGELCVAGPQLTPGYLDPADDTGRFLERDGRRFYRTGDRVRRADDGGWLYLGRQDAQVQVHGVRVELAEVDAAARTCPGVEDAVTVAVPVDGTVELAVFHTGEPVPPARLARHLRELLPAAVVPRAYHHLDTLPLNANRKTDRRKLASRAAAMRQSAGAGRTHERRQESQ
ncbi:MULTISPECIES: amino acid adenylation domain-containing protein [Streptomyces]|uniref:Amino acid adenylation domain-containing protein n=2 Tax=Streptomyces tricolor TaxID=68277 RepID=A0ABS9JHE0_9ACTN|nr:amino acid adenylation domain-containing protein [Streptomyces tricolor]MCG0064991.1 amino acid adenylation domain-containing protein [Streptomyces tricolor]CUW33051.1 Tyrocidine synthase 3 [Streptomyces reticuli]